MRADGKAVWIVDSRGKGVLATLDLESGDLGRFDAEPIDREMGHSSQGARFDRSGNQTGDVMVRPAWATLEGGQELEPIASYAAR